MWNSGVTAIADNYLNVHLLRVILQHRHRFQLYAKRLTQRTRAIPTSIAFTIASRELMKLEDTDVAQLDEMYKAR